VRIGGIELFLRMSRWAPPHRRAAPDAVQLASMWDATKAHMSVRSSKYRVLPLGTCVMLPRHRTTPDESHLSSIQTLRTNECVFDWGGLRQSSGAGSGKR
jgi:hypothetical protein